MGVSGLVGGVISAIAVVAVVDRVAPTSMAEGADAGAESNLANRGWLDASPLSHLAVTGIPNGSAVATTDARDAGAPEQSTTTLSSADVGDAGATAIGDAGEHRVLAMPSLQHEAGASPALSSSEASEPSEVASRAPGALQDMDAGTATEQASNDADAQAPRASNDEDAQAPRASNDDAGVSNPSGPNPIGPPLSAGAGSFTTEAPYWAASSWTHADAGAGPFATDAPPSSASSFTSDPQAGAGAFTTEWNIPGFGFLYYPY